MIKIQKFIFNPFFVNTYIIWDEESREAAIVDPGCSNSMEEKQILEFINTKNLKLNYIINTHCHIDHIFGNSFVKEKFNSKLLMPEKDIFLLDIMKEQAENFGFSFNHSPLPDEFISEDKSLQLGNSKVKFIFTPGHTPGEFCILFEEEKLCITGDVIFKESIGRTDLWGGDYETLIHSIKTKILIQQDDVIILPGHGEDSTIKHEKQFNYYLINI